MEIIEKCVRYFYRCLESYFDTMLFSGGRRVYYIFITVFSIFLLVLAFDFFGIPTIVGILEALFAVIVIGILCAVDYVNKSGVEMLKSKMLNKLRRWKE